MTRVSPRHDWILEANPSLRRVCGFMRMAIRNNSRSAARARCRDCGRAAPVAPPRIAEAPRFRQGGPEARWGRRMRCLDGPVDHPRGKNVLGLTWQHATYCHGFAPPPPSLH
jgi:hypothetical protein